jgi:hypothetical protein
MLHDIMTQDMRLLRKSLAHIGQTLFLLHCMSACVLGSVEQHGNFGPLPASQSEGSNEYQSHL